MNIRSAIRQLARKSYADESSPHKGDLLDCALGRNSFGTSEMVRDYARRYDDWSNLWHHPDTSYKDLKEKICRFWSTYADLTARNVKVANGSCVVLSRLNKLFIEAGVKVLGYAPQFAEYMVEVAVLGGTYEAVPLDPTENLSFNLDRFLDRLTSEYRIAYIDNPNNPTGQLIALQEIKAIVTEAMKKGIIVILDEAYGDYVEEKHSAVNLINHYANLVVTRTFTKAYGVGQFRVGYAVLSTELGDYYDRVDLPFSISTMGAALATEALLDQDFIFILRSQVKTEKEKLIHGLSDRGYLITKTSEYCPIFVARHPDEDIDLREELFDKGILTTSGDDYANLGANYVRINTPPRADGFLERL